MNDFDRYLELNLRRMLGPVVATQPPARARRPKGARSPVLVVVTPASGIGPEAIPSAEPVPVTVAATALPQH